MVATGIGVGGITAFVHEESATDRSHRHDGGRHKQSGPAVRRTGCKELKRRKISRTIMFGVLELSGVMRR
jgi:hypothetical protein